MTSLADRHLLPKMLKKTTKYTEEDRDRVRTFHKQGMSIHSIAKEIPMSRRMVQFIIYPERMALAKKLFAIRQKDGRYRYPTEVQTAKVRATRTRKRAMLNQLISKI